MATERVGELVPNDNGNLPEADVREAVNDYALLAELGGDVAGALTLLEEGQEPSTEPTQSRWTPMTSSGS
jgi:hypothetical protein